MTYDNFEPFQNMQKQSFGFQPTRYEVWIGGKMINRGGTNFPIVAKVIQLDNSEKIEVTFNDTSLHNELSQTNMFDEFVTAIDRLQLIIVPEETNVECMGIIGFKMILGATRAYKHFNRNEPYCCNLFLQNGVIEKMTFSFSNPEKLIEFYSNENDTANTAESNEQQKSETQTEQKPKKETALQQANREVNEAIKADKERKAQEILKANKNKDSLIAKLEMRIDLTNPFNECMNNLRNWRSRYSKSEYPEKVVLNIFYRQYTMDSIWNTQINNSFDMFKNTETDVLAAFEKLEMEYSNASGYFIVGNRLKDLMNEQEDVGGLNYKNNIPIISSCQGGDNKALEELEFTYIYYMLCNKITLMWAAFGRNGVTRVDAIAQVTGVVINYNQPITYAGILGILGQLGVSRALNKMYSPLTNLY